MATFKGASKQKAFKPPYNWCCGTGSSGLWSKLTVGQQSNQQANSQVTVSAIDCCTSAKKQHVRWRHMQARPTKAEILPHIVTVKVHNTCTQLQHNRTYAASKHSGNMYSLAKYLLTHTQHSLAFVYTIWKYLTLELNIVIAAAIVVACVCACVWISTCRVLDSDFHLQLAEFTLLTP